MPVAHSARSRLIALLLAAGVTTGLAAARQPEPKAPPPPDAPPIVIDDEDEPDMNWGPIAVPDTDLGKAVKWVVEVINGDQPLGNPADHFTDAFLDTPSGPKIRERLTTLRRQAFDGHEVQIIHMDRQDNADAGAFTLNGKDTKTILNVFAVVDPRTGKLAGLSFAAPPPGANGNADIPQSFGDMDGAMGGLGGGSSLGIYELLPLDPADLTKGYRLAAVYEYGDTRPQNINALAMLFPLGELANQIAAGHRDWTSAVTIHDKVKSLPGSPFYDLPDGTTKTLAEIAKGTMEGDFTAADLLITTLGTTAIEDWDRRIVQLNAPESIGLNQPFLTTRQAYTIKLAKDRTLADRYIQADEVDRREMLTKEVAASEPDAEVAGDLDTPLAIEHVGWFATVRDVGRAWAELHRLESQPTMAPLKEALRAGPPILNLNQDRWSDVSSKSGQEPGVMAMSWKLKRSDDRWFVVVAVWNNPSEQLEQNRFFQLAASGLDILSKFEAGDDKAAPPPLEKKIKHKGPRF